MGARKRRRQLRSLSLPDTSYLPRKVSSSLLEGSVVSLKSASWDSVGGKEEVGNVFVQFLVRRFTFETVFFID